MKALPSHLGKGEITSCNRAVSSQKMEGRVGTEGGAGAGGGEAELSPLTVYTGG